MMESMMAGRELDALIAGKVMGWANVICLHGGNIPSGEPDDDWNKDARNDQHHGHTGIPLVHREQVPAYSVDIAAAWEVVEKLRTMSIGISIARMPDEKLWYVPLYRLDHGEYMGSAEGFAEAETAPLAICLAALKAVDA